MKGWGILPRDKDRGHGLDEEEGSYKHLGAESSKICPNDLYLEVSKDKAIHLISKICQVRWTIDPP